MDMDSIMYNIVAVAVSLVLFWRLIDFLFPWLKHDIKQIRAVLSATNQMKNMGKRSPVYTMVEKLIDQAKSIPDKNFIYYEDEIWTYRKFNEYCNQIARVMYEAGFRRGDVIAIFMHSCPQFVGICFGVGKTGASTAFINDSLLGNSLIHCLKISGCKAIVIPNDEKFIKAIEDVKERLEDDIIIYILGSADAEARFKCESLNELIEKQSKDEVPSEWRKNLTPKDHFFYIYTSGTTGFPKAATIRHDRGMLTHIIFRLVECRPDDIVYAPLPLYHSSAGLIGVLGTIYTGCSIVVRKKFSASHFWEDCRRYRATCAMYIGETIRYVCNQPPHPDDKNHCVRVFVGNGLRPQVWKTFLKRFGENIQVREFFGATEGNCMFLNTDNSIGSIGMHSPLMKAAAMIRFVKYDMEEEKIVRDNKGRCIDVPDGTPGLLIGKISDRTPFHGYHKNDKQTESKILRNVFKDGDSYFNTGDLLRRDPDYHVYFVDRIGDTFRWKGHNVSTNEVSDIMSDAPGIKEVNVYGVEIPGNEGRAGMMVVLLKEDAKLDCTGVYKHACDRLASYARPLFLRVKQEIELTGTFKQKKVQLRNEGCNPKNMNGDPIYYMDHQKACYSLLSQKAYDDILDNKIRL